MRLPFYRRQKRSSSAIRAIDDRTGPCLPACLPACLLIDPYESVVAIYSMGTNNIDKVMVSLREQYPGDSELVNSLVARVVDRRQQREDAAKDQTRA